MRRKPVAGVDVDVGREGNAKQQRPLTPSRVSNAIGTEVVGHLPAADKDGRKRGGSSRSSTPAWDENMDSTNATMTRRTAASLTAEQRRPRSRTRSSSARERSTVVATDEAEHQTRSYFSALSRRLSCSSERKTVVTTVDEDHLSKRTSFVPVFAVSERVEDRKRPLGSAATVAEKDSKLHRRPSWGRSSKKEQVVEESASHLSKRASRMGLLELEKDLLPSLNDTVERMTHGLSKVESRSERLSVERGAREPQRGGRNVHHQENWLSPTLAETSPMTPQQNLLTPTLSDFPSAVKRGRSPTSPNSSAIPKPKSILKSGFRPSANSERVSFEDDRTNCERATLIVSSKTHVSSSTIPSQNPQGALEPYGQRGARYSPSTSKSPRDSLQVGVTDGRGIPRVSIASPRWSPKPPPHSHKTHTSAQSTRNCDKLPVFSQDTSDLPSIKSASTVGGLGSEDATSADERYLAAEQAINATAQHTMNYQYFGNHEDGRFLSSTPKRTTSRGALAEEDLDDSEDSDYDTEASLGKDSGESQVRRRQELVDLVSGMSHEEHSRRSRNSGPGCLSLRRHRLGVNVQTIEEDTRSIDSDGASGDESACFGIAIGGSTPTTSSLDNSTRSINPPRSRNSSVTNNSRLRHERGSGDQYCTNKHLSVEAHVSAEENRDSVLLLNADLQREAFGIPPSSSSLGGSCSGYSSAESSLSLQNVALAPDPEDDSRRGLGLSFGAEKLFQSLSLGGAVSSAANSKRYQEFEEHVERHAHRHSKVLSQGGYLADLSKTDLSKDKNSLPFKGSPLKRRHHDRGQLGGPPSPNTNEENGRSLRNKILLRFGESEMRRQEVINELCDTERLFVLKLRSVLKTYVHPLLDENRQWVTGVPPLVANLLDWLDDIYQLHIKISTTLTHVQSTQSPIVVRIAASLRQFVPCLEVYQPYICRLDEVVETLEDAINDPHDQLGEFLRLQESDAPSEVGLISSLWLPLTRLGYYLDLFNTLWMLTSKHHSDYLPAYSLLASATVVVRVLREVKLREDEYGFIKGFMARIRGLRCGDDLVNRGRRLRAHGPLYLLHNGEDECDVGRRSTARNRRVSSKTRADSARTREKCNGSKNQRRAASLDSGLSSASSLSSIASSASSICLNNTEERSDVQGQSMSYSRIYVFVFDDLALVTKHFVSKNANGDEEIWELDPGIGVCRVLSISLYAGDSQALSLHLFPVDQNALGSGISADSSSVFVTLKVPSDRRGRLDARAQDTQQTLDLWRRAFQRCCMSSIRSLSMPSQSEDVYFALQDDEGFMTMKQTRSSMMASGLPLPKSPSLQLVEPQGTRSSAEREERGWWSLRFHDIMREVRNRDAILSELEIDSRSSPAG